MHSGGPMDDAATKAKGGYCNMCDKLINPVHTRPIQATCEDEAQYYGHDHVHDRTRAGLASEDFFETQEPKQTGQFAQLVIIQTQDALSTQVKHTKELTNKSSKS